MFFIFKAKVYNLILKSGSTSISFLYVFSKNRIIENNPASHLLIVTKSMKNFIAFSDNAVYKINKHLLVVFCRKCPWMADQTIIQLQIQCLSPAILSRIRARINRILQLFYIFLIYIVTMQKWDTQLTEWTFYFHKKTRIQNETSLFRDLFFHALAPSRDKLLYHVTKDIRGV